MAVSVFTLFHFDFEVFQIFIFFVGFFLSFSPFTYYSRHMTFLIQAIHTTTTTIITIITISSSSTIRLRAVSFFGRLHVNLQRLNFHRPDFCCNVIRCFVRCCPRALHMTHLWCRCFDAENIGCQEIIGWDLVS